MAALRSSLPVVHALAPCESTGPRFVAHETGPRPRPLVHVRQTPVGRHDSRRPGQADRGTSSRLTRTLLHLKPGQNSTKQLRAQYGDRRVCGRYRDEAQPKKRLKTVELTVAQRNGHPPAPPVADDALVPVRVGLAEVEGRHQVKQARGTWNPRPQASELRYAQVVPLQLKARIVEEEASNTGCRA